MDNQQVLPSIPVQTPQPVIQLQPDKHSSVKLKYLIGFVLLIIVLAVGTYASFMAFNKRSTDVRSEASQSDANLNQFTTVLGTEEILFGPNRYPDTAFHTLKIDTVLRAYMSRANTYVFEGSTTATLQEKGIAMEKGQTGSIDDKGRWLLSTYKVDNNKIIGWYHSEHWVAEGQFKKEIAYAESSDGGLTWTYPDFPKNRIITNDATYAGQFPQHHTGDGSVIQVDGYFYIFYRSMGGGVPHTEIARSAVSDLGKPGTWKKYYCSNSSQCDFTEAGLGGKATKINGLPGGSTRVIFNRTLNRYIFPSADEKEGFKLYFSEPGSLLEWKESRVISPPISDPSDPTANYWIRHPDASNLKHWYAYASVLNNNELEEPIDNRFYLYYAKIYPGEDHEKIYLARREVRLEPNNLWNMQSSVIALNEYKHIDSGKTRVTIEAPKPDSGYRFTKSLGYVLSGPAKDKESAMVSDCLITIWDEYAMNINIQPHNNWTQCRVPQNKFIMNLGYIYKQLQENTIPLYRCFNRPNLDHYASVSSVCGVESEESTLFGYMFPVSRTAVVVSPSPVVTTSPSPSPAPQAVHSPSQQNARFVQYINVPTTLKVGENKSISVVMQNTGSIDWTDQDGYMLGNQHRGDLWGRGTGRMRIPAGASIAPNQLVIFTTTITAPSTPGVYPLELQMLQKQIRWFGEVTPIQTIEVIE